MNFFQMLDKVEAAKAKEANAIGKKKFSQSPPAIGEAESAAAAEPKPAKAKKKKPEPLPEGKEAENILSEDEPEDEPEEPEDEKE